MADELTGADQDTALDKRDELLHGKLTDAEIGDRIGISEATVGEARLTGLDQLDDIMAQFEALVDSTEADGFLPPEDIRNARAHCDRYRVLASKARAKALDRKRGAKVDSHGAQRAGSSRPRARRTAARRAAGIRSGNDPGDPPLASVRRGTDDHPLDPRAHREGAARST